MEANTPLVFIKGMDKVLKKDLQKHKDLLQRAKGSLISFREAVSHQVKKKKYYKSLLGGGKYNDVAMKKSMNMIAIDIRHMSDKVKLAEEEIEHHTLIVDTLTGQLEEYYENKLKREDYLDATKH